MRRRSVWRSAAVTCGVAAALFVSTSHRLAYADEPTPASSNSAERSPPHEHPSDDHASLDDRSEHEESPRWSWAAIGILFASGAGLVLTRRFTVRLAVGSLLVASGVIHGLLAPQHWQEGWHLGAFFMLAALVLFGLALSVAGKTGHGYWLGVSFLAFLVGMYFLSRHMVVPGVGHLERYDFVGLLTKAVEIAAVAGYAWLLYSARRGRGRLAGGSPL